MLRYVTKKALITTSMPSLKCSPNLDHISLCHDLEELGTAIDGVKACGDASVAIAVPDTG